MSDVYAGIAGLAVGVEDGVVMLDLSTPERPEHTRLRLGPSAARELAWTLLDVTDEMIP